MKHTLQLWPYILNITETKNVYATYFFNFTDDTNESCALEITQGKCKYIPKEPKDYTVKITTETTSLRALLAKEKTVADLVQDDKIEIEGEDPLLKKFAIYFSGDPDATQSETRGFNRTENEIEIEQGKWSKPQKILILNGSPRKDKGVTGILTSFLTKGFDESDCEFDTFYITDLENKPCKGCFTCWNKKMKCVHKDDTSNLIQKLHTYDLMILAAPVYVDGLPGMVKNLFDRTIATLYPEFIIKDDHCRHPSRFPKMPHLLLLSTCGFAEHDNFNPMVEHVKEICKNMHLTYLGEILPPTGWMLFYPPLRPIYKTIIESIKQAGKEVIATGKIAEETSKKISKQIFTRGQILAVHNRTG